MSSVKERRRAQRGHWRKYPSEHDPGEHTVAGSVKVMERFHSPQLGNERSLWVYLPPSYAHGRGRYPVVYMQDGQNLLDQATAFGEEWRVDETMEAAAGDGVEAIVVAIPNMGEGRLEEYSPWGDAEHGGGRADAYLELVLHTIKPVIDRDFRTLPGREHTAVAGSSMGGLLSLYAFFRHPEAFGAAGVMSPSLWFADRRVFEFVEQAPFVPGRRLYLDIGTNEGKEALSDVRDMRDLLVGKGYERGKDFMYVVELGGAHNERAWSRRTRKMMHFLLGVPQKEEPKRKRSPVREKPYSPPPAPVPGRYGAPTSVSKQPPS